MALITGNKTEDTLVIASVLSGVALVIAAIAAWFTHILICLQTANWLFLIAGAIFFPIAVVHGVGSWFGAF